MSEVRNYFEFELVVQEVWFKDLSIFSSGGHIVQQSRIVTAILVEANVGYICEIIFKFALVVLKEMCF